MSNLIELSLIMNMSPDCIDSHTNTAFRFFKKQIIKQLRNPINQISITGQQIDILSTYLWRNGKVKNIYFIKDIIDKYKVYPLTNLEITQIKKHFYDLCQLKKKQIYIQTLIDKNKHNKTTKDTKSNKNYNERKLTLSDMSKLNLKVDQYINLTCNSTYNVGSRVKSPYRNSKQLYQGKIVSIDKKKQTCHIYFDDGDIDTNVSIKDVCLINNLNIAKIIFVDSTKIICKIEFSGQKVTLLNDGSIISKMKPFRICFQNENNSLIDMNSQISYMITMSWINSEQKLNYRIGSYTYTFNWLNLVKSNNLIGKGIQINEQTQKKRYVFLLKWDPPKDIFSEFDKISKIDLPQEYFDILEELIKSYPQIEKNLKIYHLEPQLYGDKKLELECQIQKSKNLQIDTKILVHGCSERAIENIVVKKTGFQDAGTVNGKVYGKGIYLSSNPAYSVRDYCSIGNRGTKMLLLCKVLIGGKKETNDRFKMFSNEKFRTGGSLEKGYDHIYMKPFVYVNDINIAYLIEF